MDYTFSSLPPCRIVQCVRSREGEAPTVRLVRQQTPRRRHPRGDQGDTETEKTPQAQVGGLTQPGVRPPPNEEVFRFRGEFPPSRPSVSRDVNGPIQSKTRISAGPETNLDLCDRPCCCCATSCKIISVHGRRRSPLRRN
jgi:hypothetical protein